MILSRLTLVFSLVLALHSLAEAKVCSAGRVDSAEKAGVSAALKSVLGDAKLEKNRVFVWKAKGTGDNLKIIAKGNQLYAFVKGQDIPISEICASPLGASVAFQYMNYDVVIVLKYHVASTTVIGSEYAKTPVGGLLVADLNGNPVASATAIGATSPDGGRQ